MSEPAPEPARQAPFGAAGATAAGTVAVVYNPIKGDVARVRESVIRQSIDMGYGDPLWFETSLDDVGADAARAAVAAGAGLVIASGGDGTVRAVAGALRGTGATLGIVPSGTGNLLARNLGVPIGSPVAAVEVAFHGATRVVDVGIAELYTDEGRPAEHPFMVVAGVGIDAAMIANTNPALKSRLGWLAYVDGALRSVAASKPIKTKLRIESADGTQTSHGFDMQSVLVGNVGALPGGVELLPGARIDDGVLDVAVMHPRTLFGWLYVGRTIVWENHVLRRSAFGRKLISFRSKHSPNVLSYARGTVVKVRLDRLVAAELDGDEFGEVRAVVFRTDPSSLRVRVPHGAAAGPGAGSRSGSALSRSAGRA